MDLRKIKSLIDLIDESDITEFELSEGKGSSIKIIKVKQPGDKSKEGEQCSQ